MEGEQEIENGERRSTFYRHPMRFGPGLWGLVVAVEQMQMRRVDSAVGEGLGQPLGGGRVGKGRPKELAEGESVGVVRECRGLKYLYLCMHFSSLPRPGPAQCRRTTAIWKSHPPTMYFTSTSRRTSRHPLLRSPASPTSRT